MGFRMCLWEQSNVYEQVLRLFTELIMLPPNAICIKFYDFQRFMKSSIHFFIKISIIFVMTIILSFCDTASLSSVTNCCTAVATLNVSLLGELETCTDRLVSWIACYGRCCCTVSAGFSIRLRCLWLLVLRVLTQCSCIGLLWRVELREEPSRRRSLTARPPVSFAVLAHGCNLCTTFDKISLLLQRCNCSILTYILYLSFQSTPYAGGHHPPRISRGLLEVVPDMANILAVVTMQKASLSPV
jgi:hypothetical protein